METSNYKVTGMTCGHCVNHIKEEVSAISGVSEVELVLETGAMSVKSTQPVTFEQIKEAVAEAGEYQVTQA